VNLEALHSEVERRGALLDAAIETFSALRQPARAAAKLADLEAGLEAAEDALAKGRDLAGVTVAGPLTSDFMNVAGKRDLIRTAVESATVAKGGTGASRIEFKLSEAFAPEAALDSYADSIAPHVDEDSDALFGNPAYDVDAVARRVRRVA